MADDTGVMRWPERPTCHGANSPYTGKPVVWQIRDGRRHCSWCGSVHPEALIRLVAEGAQLGGSDWKYGWPHKFYVHRVPNPAAGTMIPMYRYCGNRERLGPDAEPFEEGWREKIGEYAAPVTIQLKWYNDHLRDEGYSEEALALLIETLSMQSGIAFLRNDAGEVVYRAPYHGFQRGVYG